MFQKNPFEKLTRPLNKIWVSSEGLKYEQEPWGRQNLLETFGPSFYERWKHWEIFNVGVIMGPAGKVRDLLLNIFLMATNRAIPICDQAVFNYLLNQEHLVNEFFFDIGGGGWVCHAGTLADPRKIDQFRPFLSIQEPHWNSENQLVCVPEGPPYVIVHQYDRVPTWNEAITRRFA